MAPKIAGSNPAASAKLYFERWIMVIDEQLYMSILQIAGYHCSYCGEGLDDKSAQVDFKVPRSLGGEKTVENLAACCKPRS